MESHSNTQNAHVPPQDINAEKSLIGAILLSDTAFPDVLERIGPKDFYDEAHGKIFSAMITL